VVNEINRRERFFMSLFYPTPNKVSTTLLKKIRRLEIPLALPSRKPLVAPVVLCTIPRSSTRIP